MLTAIEFSQSRAGCARGDFECGVTILTGLLAISPQSPDTVDLVGVGFELAPLPVRTELANIPAPIYYSPSNTINSLFYQREYFTTQYFEVILSK